MFALILLVIGTPTLLAAGALVGLDTAIDNGTKAVENYGKNIEAKTRSRVEAEAVVQIEAAQDAAAAATDATWSAAWAEREAQTQNQIKTLVQLLTGA